MAANKAADEGQRQSRTSRQKTISPRCNIHATPLHRSCFLSGSMKMPTENPRTGGNAQFAQRPARRKSVSAILREAYRRFASDETTRRAVRRGLS